MYELEIWGGWSAGYLRREFPKRHFRTLGAAGKYMRGVAEFLDELGVRAAHPMTVYDAKGRDVGDKAWEEGSK